MPWRLVLLGFGVALVAPAATASKVIAVDVDGMVHPITTEIIAAAIAQAQAESAALVLVRLNTPGGLMDAMRDTIEKIVASPVPVVTYVAPSGGRAASAGFFLLEAGDVAAMAPGTNTGAAHPVLIGAQMDPVMKQKVENDAAAYLRSIAAKRGRNSALAEKAVLREQVVHREGSARPPPDRPGRARRARPAGATRRPRDHALRRPQADPPHRAARSSNTTSRRCASASSPRSPIRTSRSSCWCSARSASTWSSRSPGLIAPGVIGAHPGAARAVGHLGAADQLAGRGAAAAGLRAVRAGGEIHVARHSRRGRRGRDGAGRGAC